MYVILFFLEGLISRPYFYFIYKISLFKDLANMNKTLSISVGLNSPVMDAKPPHRGSVTHYFRNSEYNRVLIISLLVRPQGHSSDLTDLYLIAR